MYSVRMRASDSRGRHISGAEGITDAFSSVDKLVAEFTARALAHPRGTPDNIMVTVERLNRKPRLIKVLPVRTVECFSPQKAETEIKELLLNETISQKALAVALRVIRNKRTMRGAALVDAGSGRRLEPDRKRGVRATLMGVNAHALRLLRRRLARRGINTLAVIEALTLASKVASAPGVVAELCASDDPAYTTGYVASASIGYTRITNIKELGRMSGGRVFFLKPGADMEKLVRYLEQTPVLMG